MDITSCEESVGDRSVKSGGGEGGKGPGGKGGKDANGESGNGGDARSKRGEGNVHVLEDEEMQGPSVDLEKLNKRIFHADLFSIP